MNRQKDIHIINAEQKLSFYTNIRASMGGAFPLAVLLSTLAFDLSITWKVFIVIISGLLCIFFWFMAKSRFEKELVNLSELYNDNYDIDENDNCEFNCNNQQVVDGEKIKKLNKAIFYSYSTYRILERRFKRYMKYINIVNVINVISPIFVGCIYINFGSGFILPKPAVIICSITGFLATLLTCISLFFNWSQKAQINLELANENYLLFIKFSELNVNCPDFDKEYDNLLKSNNSLDKNFIRQGISEKELRFGYRAALIQFQKRCRVCNKVPQGLKATDCPACGQF